MKRSGTHRMEHSVAQHILAYYSEACVGSSGHTDTAACRLGGTRRASPRRPSAKAGTQCRRSKLTHHTHTHTHTQTNIQLLTLVRRPYTTISTLSMERSRELSDSTLTPFDETLMVPSAWTPKESVNGLFADMDGTALPKRGKEKRTNNLIRLQHIQALVPRHTLSHALGSLRRTWETLDPRTRRSRRLGIGSEQCCGVSPCPAIHNLKQQKPKTTQT